MRLAIDELRMGIEACGKREELLTLLDRDHYRPAVGFLVREQARRQGLRTGYSAAEAFRRETAADFFE